MADLMTFPDTVEEFMEKYKLIDSEHIYTNGAELVPIFRMKQWFDNKPERKTGRWIETTERLGYEDLACCECSACGHPFILGDWTIDEVKEEMSYCYRCGARMDESSPMERINAPIMPTRG